MAQNDFDIIVVGCGPGGATAGNFAARNGMRVLVLEQKREVGLPIQDGVSVLYSVSETEEAAEMKIQYRWIESMIGEHAFYSPGGYYGGGQVWPDGISIRRSCFEKGLAENATAGGARIRTDARVTDLLRDNSGKINGVRVIEGGRPRQYTCSVVIGADGVYGNVARLAGIPLPRECFVGLSYEIAGMYPRQQMPSYELHINDKISPGFFAWVLPHSDGKMAVGVNYRPDQLKEDITVRGMLAKFMRHLEEIDRYHFDKASIVSMMAGASTTIREPGSKIVADNVMLIGDGAWRPLIGCRWGSAGMLTGILTGRWAAEVATQAIKDGDVSARSLSRYAEKSAQTVAGREKDILEAREYYYKIIFLPDDKKDKIIREIGNHCSTLHLYLRGAFHLSYCLAPIKEWFMKEAA